MKSGILVAVWLTIATLNAQSQTNFKNGSIINVSNETITDALHISKGKLVSASGKSYRPEEVKTFRIDSNNYVSYENDFYQEITTGKLVSLYQKITDNRNEKMYNGPEVVGYVQTTDGGVGDYYIMSPATGKLDLVSKKNFKNYFLKTLAAQENLAGQIQSGSLGYSQIKKVTDMYNSEK